MGGDCCGNQEETEQKGQLLTPKEQKKSFFSLRWLCCFSSAPDAYEPVTGITDSSAVSTTCDTSSYQGQGGTPASVPPLRSPLMPPSMTSSPSSSESSSASSSRAPLREIVDSTPSSSMRCSN